MTTETTAFFTSPITHDGNSQVLVRDDENKSQSKKQKHLMAHCVLCPRLQCYAAAAGGATVFSFL